MAVRKRTWRTRGAAIRSAWVVNYRDQRGARRQKTFADRNTADNWAAHARYDATASRLVDFSDEELLTELLRRAQSKGRVEP